MSRIQAGWLLRASVCLLGVVAWSVSGLSARAAHTDQGAHQERGLWVGQVTLNFVNEVAVPLDENNVSIAPDPQVPTPTSDQAHMRLILHVNGAGQVSLLRDVAVLNRAASGAGGAGGVVNLNTNRSLASAGLDFVMADSDVALVTDDRLYGEFPPQPALRIASAVFDFGDSRATDAVDALVDEVAVAVAASVNANTSDLNDPTLRSAAEDNAASAATQVGSEVVTHADVAEAFVQFLSTNLTAQAIDAIADDPSVAQSHLAAAEQLRDLSFYQDSRAVDMILDVVAAVTNAPSAEARRPAAQNQAAVYADLANEYDRFIAGKNFGDMIAAAAAAAAAAATNSGATPDLIHNAIEGDPVVRTNQSYAVQIQVPMYADTRASTAVTVVLNVVEAAVINSLTNGPTDYPSIVELGDTAGREALAEDVRRYETVPEMPTTDYTDFVRGEDYEGAVATAAEAAAEAAVAEKRDNALFSLSSLERTAKAAAINALRDVYLEAARAMRTELPLEGSLGAGQGDSRLTWDIKQNNEAPLGSAALTGTIVLPASHPTNPFRHRRHPDHTVGFDITRKLRLDFDDAPPPPLSRAGYGVDRLTGTYREEIDGLHKPLGPQQNIGLKVEGKFELNRISLIDTLNAN